MKREILSLLLAAMSNGAMAEWVQVYEGDTSDAYAALLRNRFVSACFLMNDWPARGVGKLIRH
jgi:hypothetical protein